MAPWWLRSNKDESYEDELEIDDETIASIAIDTEPAVEASGDATGVEEAVEEPTPAVAESADPGAPPPEAAVEAADGSAIIEAAEPLEALNDDEEEPEETAPRKRRRRRKRKRKPAKVEPTVDAADTEAVEAPSAEPEAAAPEPPAAPPSAESEAQEEIAFDFGVTERSPATSDERKIALFCDLENIALGVRTSETKKFEINLVLERLLEKGKIIVKKAYADWERYSDYKRAFHESAIELIDIPQKKYSGKNSADIKMVVDAMDLCYSKEHLDTFVILSGDSDFSPLVSKLKENNKYVIGVGVKNSTSSHLIDNCDEFIYYEDVWRDLQHTPRLDNLSPKDAEVFGLLIDSILALVRENKTILWGSMIKQTMQRKRPSFSEGYYGYGSFTDLLEDARNKNIIRSTRDQRSGNYVVTGFGQQG